MTSRNAFLDRSPRLVRPALPALLLCAALALFFLPAHAQEDAGVVSSGWSNDGGASRALEEEPELEEDLYPELDWPRAGGPIFDPAGAMYRDEVEVLIYSLMGLLRCGAVVDR